MTTRRRKFNPNHTIQSDALRAALGKNDVAKFTRSRQCPPVKSVPQFHERPEHPNEMSRPLAERQRKAA